MLNADLAAVVAGAEVIVLGSNSPSVIEALLPLVRSDQVVVDLVGLPPACVVAGRVQGLCW